MKQNETNNKLGCIACEKFINVGSQFFIKNKQNLYIMNWVGLFSLKTSKLKKINYKIEKNCKKTKKEVIIPMDENF